VPIETVALNDLHDCALLGCLHRARLRAVHVERPVTAPAMIVVEIVRKIRRSCRSCRTITLSMCSRSIVRRRAIAMGSAPP
jgi:hypothetical protein